MHWFNLLFMHWPLPVAALREYIPASLEIDTFENSAWLGLVPFEMRKVRPRYLPSISGLSTFPELNLRTYVRFQGCPGVWFFSLDAGNPVAVRLARATFFLPYFDAAMGHHRVDHVSTFKSVRTHKRSSAASFEARYRPVGPIRRAVPGSVEHFLTERYCFFSADRNSRIYRCDVHHRPWPLQSAEADVSLNRMGQQIAIQLPEVAPLLHYAENLAVLGWWPERLG
ncbi:MAG: DUF2071 domain-containing protein [Trueperaceae bacterium]|nr:MAG: DUF2071 domain-containing protein [Trueperaceae bacterium]